MEKFLKYFSWIYKHGIMAVNLVVSIFIFLYFKNILSVILMILNVVIFIFYHEGLKYYKSKYRKKKIKTLYTITKSLIFEKAFQTLAKIAFAILIVQLIILFFIPSNKSFFLFVLYLITIVALIAKCFYEREIFFRLLKQQKSIRELLERFKKRH